MSLITCPSCGKRVSDTAENCVHCGGALKEKSVEQSFNEMSSVRQEELRSAFYGERPDLGECVKKRDKFQTVINYFRTAIIVGLMIEILYWGACIIYHNVSGKNTPDFMIMIFVIIIVLLVASVAVYFIISKIVYKKHWRNALIAEKKFQLWLNGKNIKYTVLFSDKMKKDKQFFDSVSAETQDIER